MSSLRPHSRVMYRYLERRTPETENIILLIIWMKKKKKKKKKEQWNNFIVKILFI